MSIITGIKKELRGYTAKAYIQFLSDSNRDHRNTVILAGVGRSGTTWIANTINYNLEYRQLFEPFNPLKGIANKGKISSVPAYLRPDDRDKNSLELARSILSGETKDIAIDYENFGNRKFFFQKRLIKDISANLFLRWIYVNFPGIPIILLLRHPCAVANSRIKRNIALGKQWSLYGLDDPASFFQNHKELMTDFLEPFKNEIEAIGSVFENYIFQWCIANYIPLKQFKVGEIHLVFYENFCVNPENEIKRLFEFLEKDYDELIFSKIKVPSVQAHKYSAIKTDKNNLINSWKKDLSTAQIDKALQILSLFGLDEIYSENLTPNIDNVHEFIKFN
jgi:hypothetical protein